MANDQLQRYFYAICFMCQLNFQYCGVLWSLLTNNFVMSPFGKPKPTYNRSLDFIKCDLSNV